MLATGLGLGLGLGQEFKPSTGFGALNSPAFSDVGAFTASNATATPAVAGGLDGWIVDDTSGAAIGSLIAVGMAQAVTAGLRYQISFIIHGPSSAMTTGFVGLRRSDAATTNDFFVTISGLNVVANWVNTDFTSVTVATTAMPNDLILVTASGIAAQTTTVRWNVFPDAAAASGEGQFFVSRLEMRRAL